MDSIRLSENETIPVPTICHRVDFRPQYGRLLPTRLLGGGTLRDRRSGGVMGGWANFWPRRASPLRATLQERRRWRVSNVDLSISRAGERNDGGTLRIEAVLTQLCSADGVQSALFS